MYCSVLQARNVVDYHGVILDGFYDVFSVNLDLQKLPNSDKLKIEIVLVDRGRDPDLVALEAKAKELRINTEMESNGSFRISLAKKIAFLVAEQMGGPVSSETDLLLRWKEKCGDDKRSSQNVVRKLGSMTAGWTRHRALLFKVKISRLPLSLCHRQFVRIGHVYQALFRFVLFSFCNSYSGISFRSSV
jgi:hypothetical protein